MPTPSTDDPLHVGLIYGGRSPEHEVSIDSAHNVFEALSEEHYRVTPLRISRDGRWHVEDPGAAALRDPDAFADDPSAADADAKSALFAPAEEGEEVLRRDAPDDGSESSAAAALESLALDVALPMLHGPNGEDGRVQGLLDTVGLPYVGVGVLGSAACMDKEVTKRLMRDAGLPIVPFRVLRYGGETIPFSEINGALGTPFFVKPANAGSSVGASKVEEKDGYEPAVEHAFDYDNKVLVETAMDAREIECAVIGNLEEPRAAGPGEIVSEDTFYTYEAKYDEEADAAHMEVPADLPEDVAGRIRTLAVEVYRLLDCEGMARVDFFVTSEHELAINEINTIPGFTERSMFPVMWEDAGLGASELLDELIRLALARHQRDARIKMTL
jgi:D-alanine-D-alanine ligase